VLWTVARPGQHGFQTRTEYNKRIIMLSDKPEKINPKEGFNGYGLIKNDFILVAGSIPGPRKRIVALRKAVREAKPMQLINEVKFIATKS
jgi:large subunit ribosomal protein L3